MAEGRQPRRVGEIGACGEALSKYERNQEQFDGNAYVMPCARCLPPSPLPTTLLCLALDWTHVGQSGLPLAVKLFNWSLIGCDCSALGGTAAPVQSLLPDAPSESYDSDCSSNSSFSFTSFCFLQGGRISFSVLHHQRNEFWHFTPLPRPIHLPPT